MKVIIVNGITLNIYIRILSFRKAIFKIYKKYQGRIGLTCLI